MLKKVEPRASFTKMYSGVRSQILSAIPTDADGVIAAMNERGCDLHGSCLPLLGPAEAGADLTPPGADERFHGLRVDPAIRALVAVARCLAGQAGQHRLAVLCPADPVVEEVGGPHVVAQIGSSIAAKPAERWAGDADKPHKLVGPGEDLGVHLANEKHLVSGALDGAVLLQGNPLLRLATKPLQVRAREDLCQGSLYLLSSPPSSSSPSSRPDPTKCQLK